MSSLSDEHRKKMQEAHKKLNRGKQPGRKKFRHFKCEVLDYNGIDYKSQIYPKGPGYPNRAYPKEVL